MIKDHLDLHIDKNYDSYYRPNIVGEIEPFEGLVDEANLMSSFDKLNLFKLLIEK